MKSITKLAFGAALAAGLVLAPEAGAQSEQQGRARPERGQRMDPAQRVERRVGMLTERLQLSQTQATQIRQILTQESEQMRAIFEKGQAGADRETLRPQMQSLRQDTEKKIDAVLTEEQRKTYSEWQEQMRKERARRGDGPRGERPPRKS
jgi:Spy/CpxP family protein refolding chaperone